MNLVCYANGLLVLETNSDFISLLMRKSASPPNRWSVSKIQLSLNYYILDGLNIFSNSQYTSHQNTRICLQPRMRTCHEIRLVPNTVQSFWLTRSIYFWGPHRVGLHESNVWESVPFFQRLPWTSLLPSAANSSDKDRRILVPQDLQEAQMWGSA